MTYNNIEIPDDAVGIQAKSVEEAWITNERYTNDDVIWGRPKGILHGQFAGTHPEQYAALYPDGSSTYFVSIFTLQAGWKLRFDGEFPHARYQSFTLANYLGNNQNGNGQYIRSDQLIADHGSFNPFLEGANRNVNSRKYTLWIVQQDEPSTPEPNTLYVGASSINGETRLAMRTYLTDAGYDGTGVIPLRKGGNGLPVVTLIKPDGTEVKGVQLLTELNVVKRREPVFPASVWLNQIKKSANPISAPATSDAKAELFWDIPYSVLGRFYASNPLARVTNFPVSSEGGFANNPDTKYLTFAYSFEFGKILVITGKMPSFPRTSSGESVADVNTQVKYFSVTTGASPVSGNGFMTVYDEKIPVDANGYYKLVISRPWDRPANATITNGVVWMDPDVGEGADYLGGRANFGSIYFRFQAPNPNWAESPANVPIPTIDDPIQKESVVMGPYYPTGEYMSREDFEALA